MSVDLNAIAAVAAAAPGGPPGRRGEMLRHVTDLFIVGADRYSDEQIALFDDIFSGLAAHIERSARALLAIRLAPIAKAPPRIIRALAFDDEIDVAGPVLVQSERIDEIALLENAKLKSQDHLLAISRRRSLGEPITEVLVERGDRQVVLSTVGNCGARFSDTGFARLVRRSEGDDELTRCVGGRPELPPRLFRELLAKASQTVRARLEADHPHARREVERAVAEVTRRVGAEPVASAAELAAARGVVDRLQRSGELDDARLAALASAGQLAQTTAALAAMAELPLHLAQRAMQHERTDTLLVIARAIGLSWPTVRAIMGLRAREHGLSLPEVAQCLSSFERLSPATATEIIQFYRRREQAGSARQNH